MILFANANSMLKNSCKNLQMHITKTDATDRINLAVRYFQLTLMTQKIHQIEIYKYFQQISAELKM